MENNKYLIDIISKTCFNNTSTVIADIIYQYSDNVYHLKNILTILNNCQHNVHIETSINYDKKAVYIYSLISDTPVQIILTTGIDSLFINAYCGYKRSDALSTYYMFNCEYYQLVSNSNNQYHSGFIPNSYKLNDHINSICDIVASYINRYNGFL